MLTKKDIKPFTSATVIITLKNQDPIVLKNCKVYEHSTKSIRVLLPKEYEFLYLDYPTKKHQNGFEHKEENIICKKGNMEIIFN